MLDMASGQTIALLAVMTYPHATGGYYREHRLVVLPDYQGIGIGNRLSDAVAAAHVAHGRRYFGSTLHPAIIAYRNRHPSWVMTAAPRRVGRSKGFRHLSDKASRSRMIATFRFVGSPNREAAEILGIKR